MNHPPSSNNAKPSPELGDALANLPGVTRKQIAQAARVTLGMVDAWIAGTKTVSHRRLMLMLQRGPQELVDAILHFLAAGTNRMVVPRDRIVAGDANGAVVGAVKETTDILLAYHRGDSPEQIGVECDEAIRAIDTVKQHTAAHPMRLRPTA